MQISCPKCSARYELDDRLVPPGGAPVQCTSCKFIFTAKAESAPPPPRAAPSGRPPEVAAAKTQIFGRPPMKPIGAPPPQNPAPRPNLAGAPAANAPVGQPKETMLFGSPAGTPSVTPDPAPPPLHTQIFGMPAVPVRAAAAAPAPNAKPAAAGPKPPAAAVRLPARPAGPAASVPSPAMEVPLAARKPAPMARPELPLELPEMAPPRAARVELPPADLPFLQQMSMPESSESVIGMTFFERHRAAIILFSLMALGFGFFTVQLLTRRRTTLSPEAAAMHERAIGLLRRDDSASKKEATKQLDELGKSFPGFLQGKATLVVALSLQWDDAQATMKQNQLALDELVRKIARAEERKASSDWQNRVNSMNEQIRVLRNQVVPLSEQASVLGRRANDALVALEAQAKEAEAGGDRTAVARAEAVYFGVKASDQTIPLAEKYRSMGGVDGWEAIALGEYVANGKAPPGVPAKAKALLERLRATDPAFLRAYLLGARLEINEHHYDSASTLLDAAVALNPSHDVARRMLGWLQELQQPDVARLP